MPQPKITTRVEGSVADPKEQAKIEKSIRGKKGQAPSTAEQSGTFVDWQQIRDSLGQPFVADRPPPLRKLKEMAKDPMLRFGMHHITTPHVRAQYHFEAIDNDGPNAQVAGFFDSMWRPVHASYMMQSLLSVRWGHQPLVKRFVSGNPGGVYRDTTEQNVENQMKPVWDEGTIEPIILDTFVPLDPQRCQPLFDDSSGEFTGIQYEVPAADRKRNLGFGSSSSNDNFREIDVYHALWITHNRAEEMGSIYGYPRLALAYRYWWSHWYAWAMIDRAIERMAIPPLVAYHPEGDWEDPENPEETRPYSEIALDTAERLRANAIAAVPSTLQSSGLDEKGSNQREWEFKFLETENAPIEQMIAFAQYCDVMKLRSIWIPEGSLIEGEGGSAQRNIVSQMTETFVESQANLFDELIEYPNRYVFPQIAVVNFPEFVNNGGRVRLVGHGFAREDIELLKQLIQLVGQSDPLRLGVDIRQGLQRLNVPLLDPVEQQRQINEAAAANQQPPVVNGVTTTVPGFAPGNTNGGSVPEPAAPGASSLGFEDSVVYFQPQESFMLSESEDFLTSLPGSEHYQDKTMRALMLRLRKLWQAHTREIYRDLSRHIKDEKLELADERKTVTKKEAVKRANKILKEWSVSSKRLQILADQSRIIIEKMATRSAKINAKKANISISLDEDVFDDWVVSQVGRLIKSTHRTIEDEVKDFLVNEIREGHDSDVVAKNLADHFGEMTATKADTIARSETRDAFNAGTLIAGEQAKLKYVKASDGKLFDKKCADRDGKLMTIAEAWREASPANTHPRCQLGFELLARADFSVKNVSELPEGAPEEAYAFFDDSTSTAYIHQEAANGAADRWLSSLIDVLVKEGYRESVNG